ncbi:hypothetical protein niasHS_002347 [Heterodera schachtii]|uniref:Chromo domain-containing protein n=2 Tax=Heterodera TaxID=34509 RepID=A0ABD2KJR9_HETSC
MDPDPIDGDQVYAAERLLQTRTRRGQQEFLVKWKGWNSKHNTWEPRANILDERLIQEFEQRVGTRAPKRRAVGAPPSSSGGKDPSALATSAVVFGPPQPKRGRRTNKSPNRAKKDNISDVTSPSTSMSTRRSSRRSSAAKGSHEGSVAGKSKPAETAISDSKKPSNSSPEKAQETGKMEEEKKLEPVTETEPELSTEDEEKSIMDEKKTTPEKKQEEVGPAVEQPLEIYVEHTVKTEKLRGIVQEQTQATDSASSDAPIENGQQQKNEATINEEEIIDEDAFIITNESDPAATHKIQVYTLSDSGIPNEQKATPSGSKSLVSAKPMLGQEGKGDEITVVKDEGQQQSGSVVDTVGSSEGNAHVTTNGQNKESAETNGPVERQKTWSDQQAKSKNSSEATTEFTSEAYLYNGSYTITDVTANDTTLTFIEI